MPRRTEPDPFATKLGARIRELREELGLTQENLAYEAGPKSKGHLSSIEKGLLIPTLPTLAPLAGRLIVERLDLVTFPEDSARHALVDLTRSMKSGPSRRLVREARA